MQFIICIVDQSIFTIYWAKIDNYGLIRIFSLHKPHALYYMVFFYTTIIRRRHFTVQVNKKRHYTI